MKVDPDSTISEYTRSAADTKVKPELIRTPHILSRTVQHIIYNVLPNEGDPLYNIAREATYAFVADRLRQIRKELFMQQADDDIRQRIFEFAGMFYVVSGYKLNYLDKKSFDSHDNQAQISVCLTQLLEIYDRQDYKQSLLDSAPKPNPYPFNRRCLFEAINLLLHIDSFDELNRYHKLPPNVKRHPYVKDARALLTLYINLDWRGFLRRTCNLNIILFAAIPKLIHQVQCQYLVRIAKATSNRQNLTLRVQYIANLLFPFESPSSSFSLTCQLLRSLNLIITDRKIVFTPSNVLTLERVGPKMPKKVWTNQPVDKTVDVIEEFFDIGYNDERDEF